MRNAIEWNHLKKRLNLITACIDGLYICLAVGLIGGQSHDVICRLSVNRYVIGCEDCKTVILGL